MKHFYTIITLIFTTVLSAQSYEFALVQNSDFNFSVVAIPDFDSVGNTDISDIGFALMLPTGNADVSNLTQFNGRNLSSTEVTAAVLTANGLGDGTRDGFLINLPPGQTLLSHTSGQQIIITSFDVTNMPTSGQLEILSNSDPIALGLGGTVDSFYNANIDNTTTQDYFGGIASGQGTFMFSVLHVDDATLFQEDLDLYPNPAKDITTLDTPLEVNEVKVYTINGKLVATFNGIKTLNIGNLDAGVYLLKIKVNNKISIKRLIKR
ncbi:T9SS type A sorting domain-containing protein [Winogradskyella sp. DF17]|uniref:T9SS type A sorting domain-containing protein n=1 Tax=Winogradskyella pelagia TaxID=2819984 RepID=A0ABS3SZ79_9FLAO|nr:T9SS type A sorting domain-containing protein [Winogradskyella sp. DF17]MBO3115519.1 T9SS type A sorting domain-containing protein [Winogradskyella sp. DF17]